MMVPFLWMIVTSLKTRAEVFGAAPLSLPTGAHWENYERMWNGLPGVTFGTFFLNSLKLALLNTAGQLVTCSMAAYAFAAIPFRGRGPLFGLLLATLIIPTQVVLVPNFILWRSLPNPFSESGSFYGTQEPLWVGAWLGGAFGTFLLRQFFLAVPDGARRCRPRGRRQPVADLPPDLPAAREAGARDARDLHVHVDLERPPEPADLPAAPRPVHDHRRAGVLPGPVRRASGRR